MIQSRTPGPFRLPASEWNEIAAAVNAWTANPAAAPAGGGPGVVWAQAATAILPYQPVHLPTLVNSKNLSTSLKMSRVVLEAVPLSSSVKPGDLVLGVALSYALADAVFPVQISGPVLVALDSVTSGHAFVAYENGQLVTAPRGPWRRLPCKTTADEPSDAGIILLPALPRPAEPATAAQLYEIDRTDPADDALAWDPANALPANWADYSAVKLITQTPRFDGAGGLSFVPLVLTWAAATAPVIPAADATNAGTTCGS